MTDWKEGKPPQDGKWYMALDGGNEPLAVRWDGKGFFTNLDEIWKNLTPHNPEPINIPKPRPDWLPEGWSFKKKGHPRPMVLSEEGEFVASWVRDKRVFWLPGELRASELRALARIAENLEAGRDWDSDEGGAG